MKLNSTLRCIVGRGIAYCRRNSVRQISSWNADDADYDASSRKQNNDLLRWKSSYFEIARKSDIKQQTQQSPRKQISGTKISSDTVKGTTTRSGAKTSERNLMLSGLPARGTVGAHLYQIYNHRVEGNRLNIEEYHVQLIEQANSDLFDLGYAGTVKVYAMFLPKLYRFAVEVSLPHTFQLDRSVPGIYELNKKKKKPESVAREEICKQILLSHLGPLGYTSAKRKFPSNMDLLYSYSFRNQQPSPRIFTCITHTTYPILGTAVASSPLLPAEEQLITLRGCGSHLYGPAMVSACQLAAQMLKRLDIESLEAKSKVT